MSQRSERVGDLVRAELAELMRREMRDPRLGLASVSRVEMSGDLRHATVRISALGTEPERQESIKALERAQGFLRRELGQRLSLRATPELHFVLDRGAENSQRISDMLDQLIEPEPDSGS